MADTNPAESPEDVMAQQLETFVTLLSESCQLDRGCAIAALLAYQSDIETAVKRRLDQQTQIDKSKAKVKS